MTAKPCFRKTLFQPEKPNCLKTELRNHLEIHICDMCSVFFGVNHANGDLFVYLIICIPNIGQQAFGYKKSHII